MVCWFGMIRSHGRLFRGGFAVMVCWFEEDSQPCSAGLGRIRRLGLLVRGGFYVMICAGSEGAGVAVMV